MRPLITFAVLVSITAGNLAWAEVPLKTEDELKADASQIVVGKVEAIYTKQTKTANYRKVKGVVEISVVSIEKGATAKLEPGDRIYAGFWQSKWIGKGLPEPGASGHDVPDEGNVVRAFLSRHDGKYEVLLPNGIQVIESAKVRKALEDALNKIGPDSPANAK